MIKSIKKDFKNKSIISLDQFDQQSVLKLFQRVNQLKKLSTIKLLKILPGKIATLLFFEPSSRTFSSHVAAMKRLGGQTIEYQNPLSNSSAVKGETIEDTMKMFSQYCDIIIIRHFEPGTAKIASSAATVPVINAGDGIGEHPTQALLDMYTIYEHHHRLNNLKGLLVGDLLNGRTIHSLIRGLSLFKNNTIYLLSPLSLRLSTDDKKIFNDKGIKLIDIKSINDIPSDCDFWYWTRVQKERFKSKKEYEKLKHAFILNKKLIEKKANKNTIFMHPLPRVGEIETEIDSDSRSMYLVTQPRNGLYVRMALLSLILKK